MLHTRLSYVRYASGRLASRLLGRLWCWLMERLDNKRWCTAAYEVAVLHCWFAGGFGMTIRRTYTDLLRLPFLVLKCGSYADCKWCLRCRRVESNE